MISIKQQRLWVLTTYALVGSCLWFGTLKVLFPFGGEDLLSLVTVFVTSVVTLILAKQFNSWALLGLHPLILSIVLLGINGSLLGFSNELPKYFSELMLGTLISLSFSPVVFVWTISCLGSTPRPGANPPDSFMP